MVVALVDRVGRGDRARVVVDRSRGASGTPRIERAPATRPKRVPAETPTRVSRRSRRTRQGDVLSSTFDEAVGQPAPSCAPRSTRPDEVAVDPPITAGLPDAVDHPGPRNDRADTHG